MALAHSGTRRPDATGPVSEELAVTYRLDGGELRLSRVTLIEGYTDRTSVKTILATSRWGCADQAHLDRIRVVNERVLS